MISIRRSLAISRLIVIDGLKRYALLALVGLCLASEAGALLFFDFIPRDIGRASSDFVFSIAWISGLLFLLFHAIQTLSWGGEQSVIYTLLARPISRSEYVIGTYIGLGVLLFFLNTILALIGWVTLTIIKHKVIEAYFPNLTLSYYLLSWFGLFVMEMIILSAATLFSSMIRGGFIILLLTVFYYFICSGLPVAQEAIRQGIVGQSKGILLKFFDSLSLIFPDFNRLDFKSLITATSTNLDYSSILFNFGLVFLYISILIYASCMIYSKRDLQ